MIGNNINQIAKSLNSEKFKKEMDKDIILFSLLNLQNIKDDLLNLREDCEGIVNDS